MSKFLDEWPEILKTTKKNRSFAYALDKNENKDDASAPSKFQKTFHNGQKMTMTFNLYLQLLPIQWIIWCNENKDDVDNHDDRSASHANLAWLNSLLDSIMKANSIVLFMLNRKTRQFHIQTKYRKISSIVHWDAGMMGALCVFLAQYHVFNSTSVHGQPLFTTRSTDLIPCGQFSSTSNPTYPLSNF